MTLGRSTTQLPQDDNIEQRNTMTPNITKLSIASIVGVIGMKLDHSDIMDMVFVSFWTQIQVVLNTIQYGY